MTETESVAERAYLALQAKRKADKDAKAEAARQKALERSARIKKDSKEIRTLLQEGEFADPRWEAFEVEYLDPSAMKSVAGVIFKHPSLWVPDIYVDCGGQVFETTTDQYGPCKFGPPLDLVYFGQLIEKRKNGTISVLVNRS